MERAVSLLLCCAQTQSTADLVGDLNRNHAESKTSLLIDHKWRVGLANQMPSDLRQRELKRI